MLTLEDFSIHLKFQARLPETTKINPREHCCMECSKKLLGPDPISMCSRRTAHPEETEFEPGVWADVNKCVRCTDQNLDCKPVPSVLQVPLTALCVLNEFLDATTYDFDPDKHVPIQTRWNDILSTLVRNYHAALVRDGSQFDNDIIVSTVAYLESAMNVLADECQKSFG